jgi:hypothetical protein
MRKGGTDRGRCRGGVIDIVSLVAPGALRSTDQSSAAAPWNSGCLSPVARRSITTIWSLLSSSVSSARTAVHATAHEHMTRRKDAVWKDLDRRAAPTLPPHRRAPIPLTIVSLGDRILFAARHNRPQVIAESRVFASTFLQTHLRHVRPPLSVTTIGTVATHNFPMRARALLSTMSPRHVEQRKDSQR